VRENSHKTDTFPAESRASCAPGVQPRWPSRYWPWKVVAFLLAATLLSYLDRQALSVVAPRVAEELSLDNARLGLLLSAFFWSYALGHLVVGWPLDRLNLRVVYPLFVALWSVAQIGCGLSRSLRELFAARLFLGAFEAAAQPGAARIIARIMGKSDRTFANGLMMSGGSLGAMIAPPLMIWLSNTWGWREGFVLIGLTGLLWAASFYVWFRPGGEVLYGGQCEQARQAEDRWPLILRSSRFWSCALGAACTIPLIHIAGAWVPTYFVQRWNLGLTGKLGAILLIIYGGLDAGFIGGGALVRWLSRRGRSAVRARKMVMATSAGLMACAALVPLAGSPWIAVLLIFLLNMARASWGAIFLAFNQDIAPGRVAQIAGIYGCIGSLMGACLVWLLGIISRSAGFDIPFLIIGVLGVAGTVPVLLTRW